MIVAYVWQILEMASILTLATLIGTMPEMGEWVSWQNGTSEAIEQ